MLECAAYLVLRRRFREVSYWRGRGEVDFVVEREGKPMPVQVSWEGETERGLAALEHFYEQFPHAAEAVWIDQEEFADGVPSLVG